jgi:hypothetical protein
VDGLVDIDEFKGETAEPLALIEAVADTEEDELFGAETDMKSDDDFVLLTAPDSDELQDALGEIVADVDGLVDIEKFRGETVSVVEPVMLIEAEADA